MQVFDLCRRRLAAAGVVTAELFDLWTALVAGLSSQQVANDAGGDRWLRLVDEAVEMYADHVLSKPKPRRRR